MTASVAADAVSPPQAKDSEAAAVVGTSSAASVAVAAPRNVASLASTPDTAALPSEEDKTKPADASAGPEPSSDAAADDDGDDAESPSETADASPSDDAAPAADATDEPAPPAAAEQDAEPKDEEQPAEPEQAADQPAEDAKPDETAEADQAVKPVEAAEPVEAKAVEAAEAVDPAEDEPEAVETAEDAPDEAATADAEPEATDAEAKAADAEAATADAEREAAGAESASEPEESESPGEPIITAAMPSHNASVVLEVSPPPDKIVVAAAKPADDETPAADTKETETAALTPPGDPAPAPPVPAAKDETSAEDAPLDTAPSEDEKAEAAEPDNSSAEAEPAPKDEDRIAPGTAETTAETPGEGADAPDADSSETAAGGSPTDDAEQGPATVDEPPAHPVVAAIRTTLADEGFRKTADATDLKALEAFYETREEPPLWVSDTGFSDKAQAVIAEIGKADDWGLNASAFALPEAGAHPATEDEQASLELKLDLAALKYARHAQGGRARPSAYSPLFDQNPPIRDSKTVLTEMAAASSPDGYLTSLHPQHDQFKSLHAALKRARASAEANGGKPSSDREVQLLVINMERWRWLPRSLGSYYVWDNVPEFNVRVMKGGKPIYLEKTIVGQYKYATPFFSAPMRNIVFHPNWTVPPTIVKEDLAPKLQGPSGGLFSASKTDTLRKYGLSVSYKGEPINADSVDWNNVNIHAYTFTQDPGPYNVLGKFKFNFPNRHAIYMHDTVQPELFAERIRTLSHGCIRVNQPDKLATLLLSQDKGWSAAQVQSLTAKNESAVISLNRQVPVHLTYFTAVVEDGRLNTFGDIYGIDNRMAAKLFDNPAKFPVPVEATIAETSTQDQPRQRQRTGGGLDNFISGL
ncbi:MAG TPA: L,D-transpeptidase family protein, partial [Alphaproteobacteria bacterium]|nr:L,D-transpeptidase family protein [Alphaproteobacteria bacterium]